MSDPTGRGGETPIRDYCWLAIGSFVCAVMLWIFWPRVDPVDNEFFNLYAGAKLGPRVLYDPQGFAGVAASLHRTVMDSRLYYCRMPYYAVLTAPLAWFSYGTALVIWQTIQALAMIVAAILWPAGKARLLSVTALSLPAVCAFVTVQDAGLLLLFLAATVTLAVRGRSVSAGAVFALCLMKPHLVFLVLLVMALRREYRFLLGTAAGASALAALSFLVGPRDWPYEWMATVSSPHVSPFAAASPGLRALVQSQTGLEIAMAVVTSIVIGVWVCARQYPLEKAVAVALAGGVIVNVHSLAVDCVLLIPLVAMSLESRRTVERWLGFYLAMPPVYLAMLLGMPGWVRSAVMALIYLHALPVRQKTASSVPDVVDFASNSAA